MKLVRFVEERFLAPLIVGIIAGTFAALLTADFLSQFGGGVHGPSQGSATAMVWLQAAKAFLLVAGGVVVVFGVIPVLCDRNSGSPQPPESDSSSR